MLKSELGIWGLRFRDAVEKVTPGLSHCQNYQLSDQAYLNRLPQVKFTWWKMQKMSVFFIETRFLVQSLDKTLVLCFTYVFNVYDIFGMVWYTQVELFLVISALTRIFRYLNNKIDMAVFQKGEGTGLEWQCLNKSCHLLREAFCLAAWAFSENTKWPQVPSSGLPLKEPEPGESPCEVALPRDGEQGLLGAPHHVVVPGVGKHHLVRVDEH